MTRCPTTVEDPRKARAGNGVAGESPAASLGLALIETESAVLGHPCFCLARRCADHAPGWEAGARSPSRQMIGTGGGRP
jgi:hypothetical protein